MTFGKDRRHAFPVHLSARLTEMSRRKIILTADDFQRLESLLGSNVARVAGNSERLDELRAELDRAKVVPRHKVPRDLVTMESTVAVRDLETAEVETYTLVYPDRADIARQMLSILAPIGTAILGYRVGDEIQWRVPGGSRRLEIEQLLFQPERDSMP